MKNAEEYATINFSITDQSKFDREKSVKISGITLFSVEKYLSSYFPCLQLLSEGNSDKRQRRVEYVVECNWTLSCQKDRRCLIRDTNHISDGNNETLIFAHSPTSCFDLLQTEILSIKCIMQYQEKGGGNGITGRVEGNYVTNSFNYSVLSKL